MKKSICVFLALAVNITIMAQSDSLQMEGRNCRPEPYEIDEVVVTGTRNAVDLRHLPYTLTVIDRQELTEQNRTSVLPTAMEHVPGLIVTSRSVMGYGVSTGSTGCLSLRGVSGDAAQFLVLIDGHPQYNGVFGHPISDSYQTLMAERVEVLRGPASVLYGSNAMGGVLNVVTRSVNKDGSSTHINLGAGSYGTIQTEASNQLRSGRFSSTAAVQYLRSDNHRRNAAFEQYGGYVKFGYEIAEYWDITADLNLTHFNASNPGTVKEPKLENDQWITRGVASITLENHYYNTNGALNIYDSFGRHKINDGYNANGGSPQTDLFRSKDAVAGVSWYQSAEFFEGNRVTAGFDYHHIYGHAWYTDRKTGEIVTTPRRLKQSAHAHENEVAGYIDLRQDFAQQFTIDLGLRYNYHSQAGGEWVPQAGIVWRPINTGEVRASMSKGFRNPTTRDMYMYGTANHDSLRAERMWNYELSWKHRIGTFTYGANVFYIKSDNMIQNVAGIYVNTGELENYGVEMEAQWKINNHWKLNTNHALLHMKNPIVAAPEYKGYIGASYNSKRWNVLAGLQYINGLYTEITPTEVKENVVLLNASVNYQLTSAVSLWVRGDNLLAQEYELKSGYPMPRATFMSGVNISF